MFLPERRSGLVSLRIIKKERRMAMEYFNTWPKKVGSEVFDCNDLSDSEWKNRQLFLVTGYHSDMDREANRLEDAPLFTDEEVDCPF